MQTESVAHSTAPVTSAAKSLHFEVSRKGWSNRSTANSPMIQLSERYYASKPKKAFTEKMIVSIVHSW
jgi:hypothetical protein